MDTCRQKHQHLTELYQYIQTSRVIYTLSLGYIGLAISLFIFYNHIHINIFDSTAIPIYANPIILFVVGVILASLNYMERHGIDILEGER